MSKDASDKRGHRGICRKCAAANAGVYRKNHPEKYRAAMLKSVRLKLYGEDGLAHFEEQRCIQQNDCAICFQPLTKACRDHNHSTGRWRGVLCDCCNRAIGLLKEDVAVLESAIAYLKKWA